MAKKRSWRDFEKAKTKTAWNKQRKSLPRDTYKIFNGEYYARPYSMLRNDKVKARKAELKALGYSVRVVKKGKFSSIYKRPNFEKKSKKK